MNLFKYLFPTDWVDVSKHTINRYSSISGSEEGVSALVVVQKSTSTGRYRKQTITIL